LEALAVSGRPSLRHEIVRRIDRVLGLPEFTPRDEAPRGERITWARAIGELVGRFPWASPEAVGAMPLAQWEMVRCLGVPPEEGDPLPEDPELMERVNEARRQFFGVGVGRPLPEPEPVTESDSLTVIEEADPC
jgi:hypothetical protein